VGVFWPYCKQADIFGKTCPRVNSAKRKLWNTFSSNDRIFEKFLQEKAVEATKQKEEKRKKTKPEEHEGMPQRRHYPHEKRRGDRNPECHEEQQKDVA
jgi:hypothetical protein